MYDFAHCLSDAIEGITHSLCTLEFVDHRPLYDWVLESFPCHPQQIEFARLNLTHTVMSKRKLQASWWTGGTSAAGTIPRMPTLAACAGAATRPPSIRSFSEGVGGQARQHHPARPARVPPSAKI